MAPKKVVERKHEVQAELLNVELVRAKSSLNLSIDAHKEKIGELQIGRGSLYGSGRNRKRSRRIPWSDFAAKMDRLAYGAS